jgi:uncharacterized membrane protein YebE (DUF533 family)
MSFIRTLALLAAGFAAAKGLDKLNKAGGLKGLGAKTSDPAPTRDVAAEMGAPAATSDVAAGDAKVQQALARMGSAAAAGADAAAAGLGRLMTALGGAVAAGSSATAGMIDALTGGDTGGETEAQAKLMVRAMIEAAKADGEIDATERARILEVLAGAGSEERAWVEGLLDAPADMAGLVAETTEATKAQVYAVSVSAILLDNEAETAYLRRLAEALGLAPEVVAKIHGQA